ncbi:hypothetical protein HHK36_016192 [Tetracentron sinense]|uniref:Calcium-dependent protein kinase n=1 Tax=Tetracentron sinense TaxID=13715 RepID=A0A835DEG6_TETSI|nr:hypothetical protein HHK36_016192 [Tetracentron sinense]
MGFMCSTRELEETELISSHPSQNSERTLVLMETGHYKPRMTHAKGYVIMISSPVCPFLSQRDHGSKSMDFTWAGERFSEIVGSPYYMAPEVLKRNYGPEIDIWSAGVILYILLCGVPPFWAESEQGVAQAILRGLIDFKRDPWPNVSESAKNLVRHMLEPDPKLRLTAKQVLEHPWLQNAKKAPNVPLGDVVKSRLKQFSMMNRFKRKALRVIADHLSNKEVEDIKEMFKKIDTDNNGIVSIEELKAGLQKFGSPLAASEVQMFIEVVKNGTYQRGKKGHLLARAAARPSGASSGKTKLGARSWSSETSNREEKAMEDLRMIAGSVGTGKHIEWEEEHSRMHYTISPSNLI